MDLLVEAIIPKVNIEYRWNVDRDDIELNIESRLDELAISEMLMRHNYVEDVMIWVQCNNSEQWRMCMYHPIKMLEIRDMIEYLIYNNDLVVLKMIRYGTERETYTIVRKKTVVLYTPNVTMKNIDDKIPISTVPPIKIDQ
jgi:hypothetical protein